MKTSPLRLLALAGLSTLALHAQQYGDGLDINVRSGIDGPEYTKRKHDPEYAKDPKRARIFLLARVKEEKTGENLVRPVNAIAIAKQVTAQLEAHGFHAMLPGQKPEIIVMVKYGRGRLPNPHSTDEADKQRLGLSNSDPLQVWQTHDKFVGQEQKRQRAAYEKLIIQVTAFEYPPPKDPKQKDVLLWMTTIFVDDPDHRDLNQISEKMLAQGAAYFDRDIGREDEVIFHTDLPEGRVHLGSPEVVKEAK